MSYGGMIEILSFLLRNVSFELQEIKEEIL